MIGPAGMLGRSCTGPPAPRAGGCLREEDRKDRPEVDVVKERPEIGSVLVLDRASDDAELVYLARHRGGAEEWLSRDGYPNAVLQEVTADDRAADTLEGRAAA
ncbi:hypothetical protein J2Y48_004732 [Mycoplana sp. BE70]|nr:hypothetical protein [Mycoplana sp. BE70]